MTFYIFSMFYFIYIYINITYFFLKSLLNDDFI
jgi:hypothetical protein